MTSTDSLPGHTLGTLEVDSKNQTFMFEFTKPLIRLLTRNLFLYADFNNADEDSLTYSLNGTDVSKFDVDTASGQISVSSSAIFDFQSNSSC